MGVTREAGYVVLATPRSKFNLPDSPCYCLDSGGVIRRYNDQQWGDVDARVFGRDHENCPLDGQPVE
jgi:hypothetical protein